MKEQNSSNLLEFLDKKLTYKNMILLFLVGIAILLNIIILE